MTISVEKQRVRDAMRVVCSPMSSDVRRKECESFLDAMFRAKFEENAEVALDILKSVGAEGRRRKEDACSHKAESGGKELICPAFPFSASYRLASKACGCIYCEAASPC